MERENKAVFFDRDGTLNVDTHYLHLAEDFIWTPEARQAIKYCNDKGYKVIIITNQSGVARGYYPESDITDVHVWMNQKLAAIGAHLDAIYFCPHYKEGKVLRYVRECECRKPSPKMVLDAAQDFSINLAESYFVGDSEKDMICAQRAGVKGLHYTGGSLLKLVQENIE